MTDYILFLFGSFEHEEELDYFCNEVFTHKKIKNPKFLVQNMNSIIVTFSSKLEEGEELDKIISEITPVDYIITSFLFAKHTMVALNMPSKEVYDFIFDNEENIDVMMKMNVERKKPRIKELSLDNILEKINVSGINNLTEEEKKFLDKFQK